MADEEEGEGAGEELDMAERCKNFMDYMECLKDCMVCWKDFTESMGEKNDPEVATSPAPEPEEMDRADSVTAITSKTVMMSDDGTKTVSTSTLNYDGSITVTEEVTKPSIENSFAG